MFHVITIATKEFFPQTKRLLASLQNSGSDFHLTIFCDDPSTFQPLSRAGASDIRLLPEIAALGVKRAKFTAYDIALSEGGFLYLDSDVVVLQAVPELTIHPAITGCFDDLSCVSGIADRKYPWVENPELENRRFINSGVFYAPLQRREFFRELHERSLDDQIWNRYILRGRLYDNSFLCAHFNLLDEPINYVDSDIYNWQGFVVRGKLQVARRGDVLVNEHNDKVLKIAHFAGITDPDAAMSRWPVEVTSLIVSTGSDEQISREAAFVGFLGTLSPDLSEPPKDPLPAKMLNLLASETVDLVSNLRSDFTARGNYLKNPDAMVSLGYSLPYAEYRWNGLKCGNAYLDGEEYNFFQQVLRHFSIDTVVETGAGETSILMRAMGVNALSIEGQNGPWLARAREYGCNCRLVDFSAETRSFDPAALGTAVLEFAPTGEFDLLFVDSPGGTEARARTVEHLSAFARPKYVLLHDALRDARVVFDAQQAFGMGLVEFLRSPRGFVLLRSQAAAAEQNVSLPAFQKDLRVETPRIRIEVLGNDLDELGDDETGIVIRLTNLGSQALSSRYSAPIYLTYHLRSLDDQLVLWDGLRTALPFDLLPGNSAEFRPQIELPEQDKDLLLSLTLVQEHVSWFDGCSAENRTVLRVGRSPGGEPVIVHAAFVKAA